MYFKNEISSWDDLRVFHYVAEAGGLTSVAKKTGISAATLGRRILRLERELNLKLFTKHQNGYTLTAMGEELMHYSHKMHETAAAIDRWHNGFSNDNKVKISAGGWTAWFLTTHIEEISELTPNFKLELISDVGYVDILRREANIGIRNKPSKQAGLDNTKLNSVNFAIYTHCKTDTPYYEPNKAKELSKQNWIGSSLETPSALWLKKNIDANFVFSSSNVHLILEAAERGLGLCILPCFVGDTRAKLKCVSKPITSLRHDQWLVSHSEDHHFPAIRNTMNSLVQIWSKNKNCLA